MYSFQHFPSSTPWFGPQFPQFPRPAGLSPFYHQPILTSTLYQQLPQAPPVQQVPKRSGRPQYSTNPVQVKYPETFEKRLKYEIHIDDIEDKLTRESYKKKFCSLICWEEKCHIETLGKK